MDALSFFRSRMLGQLCPLPLIGDMVWLLQAEQMIPARVMHLDLVSGWPHLLVQSLAPVAAEHVLFAWTTGVLTWAEGEALAKAAAAQLLVDFADEAALRDASATCFCPRHMQGCSVQLSHGARDVYDTLLEKEGVVAAERMLLEHHACTGVAACPACDTISYDAKALGRHLQEAHADVRVKWGRKKTTACF